MGHIIHKPDEAELSDLSELFKVFGDETRLKILFALFEKERDQFLLALLGESIVEGVDKFNVQHCLT